MSRAETSVPVEPGAGSGYRRVIARALLVRSFAILALVAVPALLIAAGVPFGTGLSIAIVTVSIAAAAIAAWLGGTRIARTLAIPADTLSRAAAGEGTDGEGFQPTRAAEGMDENFAELTRELQARLADNAATVEALVRSKEQAQSSNLAKSQFLANMSHELRTPLNAIIGYATLLFEEASGSARPQAQEDLNRILRASRDLLEQVNDMLDLSSIDAGKTSLQRSVVDVRALVNAASQEFDLQRIHSKNRFEMLIEPEIGIMVSDAAKIKQCLANLLSNAFKFTRKGRVSLRVSSAGPRGQENIQFAVQDTGLGMSEQQIAQVFHHFVAGDGSVSAEAGGTGLGLAITRRLVRMMGGDLLVESQEGQGSTFTLVIPRELPKAVQSIEPPVAKRAEQAGGALGKRALVIDDDPAAVELMRRWLLRIGYDVLTAADGDEGLAAARREKPDLIILDIFMPGKTGYEVLEIIRSDETIKSTPVVVVTVDDNRALGLRLGATEYLTKPVAEAKLREVLGVYRDETQGEILIVDDDPDAGELIARCAKQVGLSCRRAYDGIEALAMIQTKPPAAIVLDLTMPGMDGFELLHHLQADARLKRIPVVIVSAREISRQEHKIIEEVGCAFYPKGHSSPREIANSLRLALAQ